MLNLEEFQEYVKLNLRDYLPENEKGAVIRTSNVTKNNGLVVHGVTVMPEGSNIAPNIYLDDYFKQYQEGRDLDEIMDKVALVTVGNLRAPEAYNNFGKDFQNFEYVRDKIIMVAVNTEKNVELLSQIPHTEIQDLSAVYKVYLGNIDDGYGTVTIRNEHMKMWDVTTEELHELALANTREILPVTVQSMNEVMRDMFGQDGMPDEIAEAMFAEMPADQQMYVITNKQKVNGAASMFYEDVLSGLSERIGTDLYILPSSLHEVIAVSTNMGTPATLAEMVQEVNAGQVAPEEQLSDHVYHFDAMTKELSLADTTLDQVKVCVAENSENYSAAQSNTEGSRPRHRR